MAPGELPRGVAVEKTPLGGDEGEEKLQNEDAPSFRHGRTRGRTAAGLREWPGEGVAHFPGISA